MRPVAVAFLTLAPYVLSAQERVVFRASPSVRVTSDPGRAERRELSPRERAANQVLIVQRGGNYYWASRGDRLLVHITSGAFHLYIDPRGGGYVKVYVPPAGASPSGETQLQYFEHVSVLMTTVTYWGPAASFDP